MVLPRGPRAKGSATSLPWSHTFREGRQTRRSCVEALLRSPAARMSMLGWQRGGSLAVKMAAEAIGAGV